MTSREGAVRGLKELGLSTYQAKTFIALQQLGVGTARDVAEVTDVPRSQVYGAAQELEDAGLLERQQSDPIRYRPINVDAAEQRLRQRIAERSADAFAYIEQTKADLDVPEGREDLWTLDGESAVSSRVLQLLERAETSVLFGVRDRSYVSSELEEALLSAVSRGVRVSVVSNDAVVRERFGDEDVTTRASTVPAEVQNRVGRMVVVDGETVLLSVIDLETGEETAIWSHETNFAVVFVQLIESFFPQL